MAPFVTRLATQSLPSSHSASPVLAGRVSTTVPVFSQVWFACSLWTVTPALERISAHQKPSLNHTLLCGLSSVGDVAPVNVWS
jgi:hypothetical protein